MSHLDHNRNFCMGYCNHHNRVDIYGTPVHCRKCAPHLFLASADDVNGPSVTISTCDIGSVVQ